MGPADALQEGAVRNQTVKDGPCGQNGVDALTDHGAPIGEAWVTEDHPAQLHVGLETDGASQTCK